MGTEGAVRAWLRERGAETIPHPGGTLYAHLSRVSERLGALGLDADVRLAGLAHAAYGTDGFDVVLLDPADRGPLRDLAGTAVEELIHLYGGCDRGRTWRRLAETGEVWSRFTGQCARPDRETLRAFADLSIVNELDVVERDPTVAARFGDYFRGVFDSWTPIASTSVTAEARQVLAA
ncbi:DUF6817 domain-containing protein [Asanoa sp. NPDC049573]|uniref:DUF6817 domain-containing protein n=1 Tax=Asanoa sp. NPDC049573 TaxID=3155396 RepID=UPI00343BD017